METRLFEVKVTMDAEVVNWKRANKLHKKSGTHWRNAAKLATPASSSTPRTDSSIMPLSTSSFAENAPTSFTLRPPPPPRHKSLHALMKLNIANWTVSDVSAWLHHTNHEALVTTCIDVGITGNQLMDAHLGLSDVNLRRLFHVQHGDLRWKQLVQDVDALHRQHTTPPMGNNAPNTTPLPALTASPRRNPSSNQNQTTLWKDFFDHMWVRAVDGGVDAVAHTTWTKKRRQYRRTVYSLAKQVATIAADNVHLLVHPESWHLANETDDLIVDTQRFAVGADRGNVVAAVVPAFPTHLIQTLVPEISTMGVLQGLAAGTFLCVTIRRLKLFNTIHVPPLDLWPTFVNHPLVSVTANNDEVKSTEPSWIKSLQRHGGGGGRGEEGGGPVRKFQAAVISMTQRRLRAKLKADALDRLAKRAKKHPTATAALEAIVHFSKRDSAIVSPTGLSEDPTIMGQ
ncbi:hypothetical protein B5M09_001792 [Aphanomyces astaci]|uniref:SAM domain-containing protein n=1 Tax=Aphanomyces astaci TaxID=112090 RepID=A0A3R7X200_APHAT|nr:hypothetical protein B5M09_001792 [Aphanomyces astaci]